MPRAGARDHRGPARRDPRPTAGDARLAVLGLGKLGGRELGYAADLDVVFVFSANDDEAVAWYSRCAQRLLGRFASAHHAAGCTSSTRGCGHRARRACS